MLVDCITLETWIYNETVGLRPIFSSLFYTQKLEIFHQFSRAQRVLILEFALEVIIIPVKKIKKVSSGC